MNKIITTSIVTLLIFSQNALAINIMQSTKLENTCSTSKNLPIYGTNGYHLHDVLNASGIGIISINSGVSVYVENDKVDIPDKWVQPTNYMPSSGKYFAIWNNGLSKLNMSKLELSDRGKTVAQVVFRIRRAYSGENNTYNYNGSYIYAKFNNKEPQLINLGNLNQSFDSSTLTTDVGCLNIKPMWCGDGVRDADYEKCDYMDPSKTMWGTGGCSIECKPFAK